MQAPTEQRQAGARRSLGQRDAEVFGRRAGLPPRVQTIRVGGAVTGTIGPPQLGETSNLSSCWPVVHRARWRAQRTDSLIRALTRSASSAASTTCSRLANTGALAFEANGPLAKSKRGRGSVTRRPVARTRGTRKAGQRVDPDGRSYGRRRRDARDWRIAGRSGARPRDLLPCHRGNQVDGYSLRAYRHIAALYALRWLSARRLAGLVTATVLWPLLRQ